MKSVADDWKIVWDEIINVADSVSTNVTSIVSTIIYNKKDIKRISYDFSSN